MDGDPSDCQDEMDPGFPKYPAGPAPSLLKTKILTLSGSVWLYLTSGGVVYVTKRIRERARYSLATGSLFFIIYTKFLVFY